jgi:hypothetical protein
MRRGDQIMSGESGNSIASCLGLDSLCFPAINERLGSGQIGNHIGVTLLHNLFAARTAQFSFVYVTVVVKMNSVF